MSGFIRCNICGEMIEVDSWLLVMYMEDEANGELQTPFVCSSCKN